MIGIEISGGDAAVERLRAFPSRLNARLGAVMATIGETLQDSARDRIGGKLGDAIAFDVASNGDAIAATARVTGIPYAAFQEYGFHGTETVRAHLRTIRQVFGRPIAPRAIMVRSFTRRVDYPAHSYLRAALADAAPDALTQIGGAVADTVAE